MKMLLKTNRLFLFACLLVAGFMSLQSCEKKVGELTDGALVELDSDLLHTPIIARFIDAKDGSSIDDVSIEVVGKDASRLYSTSGKATVKATAGLMDLAIDKSQTVSPESPFEFSIIATAPGYLQKQYSLVLTDVDAKEVVITMVNLENTPEGVKVTNHSFSADANGTTEELVLETEAGNTEASTISIPAGTKLLDASGNALIGQVNFQIVRFDPAVEGATDFGAQSNQAKMANGDVEYGVFAELSSFDFSMQVGNQEVKSFSTPLTLETKIPAGATDENNQPIGAGFMVPSWTMDEATGAWQLEGEQTIEGSGNSLTLNTPISHFSRWMLSPFFSTGLTLTGPSITINSDIPNDSELEYKYHSELVFRFWGWSFRNTQWASRTRYFRSGNQIGKPYSAWANLPYRLQVYDGPRGCNRSLLSETASFRFADNPTVSLNSLFAIQPIINLNFVARVLCDNITVKPTLYIMYKETDNNCWRLLGVMVNGEINTNQLDLDTAYDFRSVWNDEEHTLINVVIRDEAIRFGTENGMSTSEVNQALADINNLNGLINVNNVSEPLAALIINTYEIMPSQAECNDLTGN